MFTSSSSSAISTSATSTIGSSLTLPCKVSKKSAFACSPGVGGSLISSTVTIQLSFLFLSKTDVAVIVASPSATAVTKPFASTVATASLSELHVTSLLAPPVAVTFTSSCSVSPTVNVTLSGVTLIALTDDFDEPPPPPPPPLSFSFGTTTAVPFSSLLTVVPSLIGSPPPPVIPVTPLSTVISVFGVSIFDLSAPSFTSTFDTSPDPVILVLAAVVIMVSALPSTSTSALFAPSFIAIVLTLVSLSSITTDPCP